MLFKVVNSKTGAGVNCVVNFDTPDNDVLIPECVPPGGGHLFNHLSSPSGGLFIITFQVRKLGPCRGVSTARLLASFPQAVLAKSVL